MLTYLHAFRRIAHYGRYIEHIAGRLETDVLDRSGLETEFEAYERKVPRIMARYGGVVERAIRTARAPDDGTDEPFEVHVLRVSEPRALRCVPR